MEIRRRLAENDPTAYERDLPSARNNLASAYATAGHLDQATRLYERTLHDSVRVLGEHHPNTLYALNNLAFARREAGDAAGAATAYAELLADMERVLGPDHSHTLTTRHNLAYWRGTAGDAAVHP
ncbi:tetratricopeptide repeat protein [Streptomyces sp. NPDC007851]|uniref:tetratricopeptide repeat protein n=1 Tax=Streptomyces sp. NPDC007851 TaxID=3155008 RepID=UPI0033F7834A